MSVIVEKVSKKYGSQKALNNISFRINPGEITGLLGPNGAGKSTIMKIICCYLPPNEGDVFVCGFGISDQALQIRKKIGYLPENNPLYPEMYVKEHLEFVAGIHKLRDKKKRVSEMIETTGLSQEQNKKIGELSKGYKQRVGLAQALIHDPEVLILDEPTSGLDPNQIIEIRELIKTIGKNKTTILSTHIMQEVEAICQRTIILNQGEIVADELTANLPSFTGGNTLISIEFDKKVTKSQLRKLKGIITLNEAGERSWSIESEPNSDIRSDLFRFAVENGLTVLSLKKENQNLEQVFQQLTKK